MQNFWHTLARPIIAPSPMDGVTDAAYRFIVDKYGKPSLLMTEFTNVEGISRGAVRLLNAFIYHDTQTPTIAQIYGTTPDAFYNTAILVAQMGFDGIDINMGCPDKSISKSGAGAGLIRNPKLAQQIIKAVKQASLDFYNGKTIDDTPLSDDIKDWVADYKKHLPPLERSTPLNKRRLDSPLSKRGGPDKSGPGCLTNTLNKSIRTLLPVSVKTRLGYHEIITEDWIKILLETEPAAISLHGRTLKQMYTGEANWEEIGKAAYIVKQTKTVFIGNGDVRSIAEAKQKAKCYNLDGVLIGRGCFGNPWIFQGYEPTSSERIQVAIEHCEAFMRLTPEGHFASLRKHLAWYTKGLRNSNELRNELMRANTLEEVKQIFTQFTSEGLEVSTSSANGVYLTP